MDYNAKHVGKFDDWKAVVEKWTQNPNSQCNTIAVIM